jgi:hypothetical protein
VNGIREHLDNVMKTVTESISKLNLMENKVRILADEDVTTIRKRVDEAIDLSVKSNITNAEYA